MTPADDDEYAGGVVGLRLKLLEQGLRDLRQETHDFRRETQAQLEGVRLDVQQASFVPLKLYESERDSMREAIKATNVRIDGVRQLTMWAIALTFTAVGVVFAIARAFG